MFGAALRALPVIDFEMEHDFPAIGKKILILLAIQDIR